MELINSGCYGNTIIKMNQSVVAEEGKISCNVVALHLDISCTNTASFKSDGIVYWLIFLSRFKIFED